MRPELAGALIRRARLEKNWSQEGLCRGICSVSWLSKIEAGREGADPELVSALFARLGLDMAERPGDAELIGRCCEAAFSIDYEAWDGLVGYLRWEKTSVAVFTFRRTKRRLWNWPHGIFQW